MDKDNNSPLVEAAAAGNLEQLEQALAVEQSISEEAVQGLLAAAAWNSQTSAIDFLLSRYPQVPLNEETVRAGVYSGSVDLFAAILSRDPSIINLQFDRRGTPIAVACMSQRPVEFLAFLLQEGADPNQDTDIAPAPLASVAAFYQRTDAAELLLRYGARIGHSGALEVAARRGNETMVRYLVERGAWQEMDGSGMGVPELALHAATRKGHVGIVRILLDHGAKSDVKNVEGRTAYEVAEEMEMKDGKHLGEIKELLTK